MTNDVDKVVEAGTVDTTNSPEDSGTLRHRVTHHREALLKIQDDIGKVHSNRHVVPDEFHPKEGAAFWMEPSRQVCRNVEPPQSSLDWLFTLLPMTRWLSTYKWKENLITDIVAGVTVSVMLVPQSMSYAKLAGLPVQYGLYSGFTPIFAYAVFGSSRQLAIGPVALVSLLLQSGLTDLLDKEGITPDNNENYDAIYATLALQASFLAGVCFLVMGLLRLGFITIFLAPPVISGFTSGSAIIIALSQVKYFLGYSIPQDNQLQKLLKNIFADIDQFNWKTFVLGISCIIILQGLKEISTRVSRLKMVRALGPLTVVVLGLILQDTMDLEARGIPIVGDIPKGLPEFSADIIFPITDLKNLFIVVFTIVMIGFMESIAIAKKLANKHNYQIDSSLELVGLGVANLMSGFFSGYPVVGSFSRSAVNNESGAKSGISGIVTATLVGFVLLFLTSVFESLPNAVLASIVISGVLTLVDISEGIFLWKVHRLDFGVWALAFLGTLFLGPEWGLGVSIMLSLLIVIFESAYPPVSILGRLPGTNQYRNVKQYSNVEQYDGIVVYRIDSPVYFANTQNIREKIDRYYQRAQSELDGRGQKVKFIILEMSPVAHIDTGALHTLSELHGTYLETLQVKLCLANPNPKVMHRLVVSGLVDEIGKDHIFVTTQDAVEYCLVKLDEQELTVKGSIFDGAETPTKESSLPSYDVEKGKQEQTSSEENEHTA